MSRFICVLANSVKFGGRCIAGKEVFPNKAENKWSLSNTWLRPLGGAERGELYKSEYMCKGRTPTPLDIVEIPFNQPVPVIGQPEDWSIVRNKPWVYHGTFSSTTIPQLTDSPTSLWLELPNHADRVSTEYLISTKSPSIQLVSVSDLRLVLESTADYNTGQPRLKRRCHFKYKNTEYDLALTDPVMQEKFFPKFPNCSSGTVTPGPTSNATICISLSPPLNGMHYKLVAAVL